MHTRDVHIGYSLFHTRRATTTAMGRILSVPLLLLLFLHVASAASPTVVTTSAVGMDASASLTGDRVAGYVNVTPGVGIPTPGIQFAVVYDESYTVAPRVTLLTTNLRCHVSHSGTNGFDVWCSDALSTGRAHTWMYIVSA